MAGKPVIYEDARILNPESGFKEKLLCDGPTFTAGSACPFSCAFCYVPSMMVRQASVQQAKTGGLAHEDIVIRRRDPARKLLDALLTKDGRRRYADPNDRRVVYSSPLTDVAANMVLTKETVELCRIILENTPWHVRLLSKSVLISRIAEALDGYKERMIYGLSTGTLDNGLARAIEEGTPLVSKRIEVLHELQDAGFRTFGMVCPSLPQDDYGSFAREMADALRVDRLEHVWAEPLNSRGKAFERTLAALHGAGYGDTASQMVRVTNNQGAWEDYTRRLFEAHAGVIPAGKLRFLQYVTKDSAAWWGAQRERGAVLLGEHASV